jgi:hypothetical protein
MFFLALVQRMPERSSLGAAPGRAGRGCLHRAGQRVPRRRRPQGAARICDRLSGAKIDALLRKWLAILPHPSSAADRRAGYRFQMSLLQTEFSLTQVLDRSDSGRIFLEQVIRDNLYLGRPQQVGLVFGRQIRTGGRRPTPSRFRTRVLTTGVTASLHVEYKHAKLKQYHKLDRAIRTETTINDTRDFGIGKGMGNLPALRQVGFSGNRRLLATQRLGHDPIAGERVFRHITAPVDIGEARVAGLRLVTPEQWRCCPCWPSSACPCGASPTAICAMHSRPCWACFPAP